MVRWHTQFGIGREPALALWMQMTFKTARQYWGSNTCIMHYGSWPAPVQLRQSYSAMCAELAQRPESTPACPGQPCGNEQLRSCLQGLSLKACCSCGLPDSASWTLPAACRACTCCRALSLHAPINCLHCSRQTVCSYYIGSCSRAASVLYAFPWHCCKTSNLGSLRHTPSQ
jgi:hypothetical protein